jgi:adenosylcobinamide kinase/adenosylcobinamide-phosphate guanylyltransferase
MSDLTFVLGAARSGKSRLAETLASEVGGRVLYLATLEPLDDEMRDRIERHRARRPAGWATVEEPLAVVQALAAQPRYDVCLLDCLTLWISNLLLRAGISDAERASEAALGAVDDLLRWQRRATSALIIVSNEVGGGLVPESPLGRLFRDVQGRANQLVATAADKFYYVVGGHYLDIRAMGGKRVPPAPDLNPGALG